MAGRLSFAGLMATGQIIPASILRIALNQTLIPFAPQAQNHPMFCGISARYRYKGLPMSKLSLDALRLAPESLTRPFAPEQFNFSSTDDL